MHPYCKVLPIYLLEEAIYRINPQIAQNGA